MPASRRRFIRQMFTLGPAVMTFWVDVPLLRGAECNHPDPVKDCLLPDPGDATRFIPNEKRIGVRYSAAEMAQPEMARQLQEFRSAVCLVRNLPPDNLISWTKYVAQHCTRCAPANASNVHYDWQFPTWHRAFLYFLERQMRIMSDTDGLRLIYWDWENPNSRVLPAIYAPADQPLYWANRYLGPKTFPLKDTDVDVQGRLSLRSFEAFGGTALQRTPTPALYTGPHANVHNAFADPDDTGIQGDMADLQNSPRDPVFYAHHSNIDRLWSSWAALPGKERPEFGDAQVYFYDEDQKWRYVLMNDLRDESRLGYRYSSLMKPKTAPAQQRRFTSTMTANRAILTDEAVARTQAPAPDYLYIRNIRNLEAFPPDTRNYGVFRESVPAGTAAATSPAFLDVVSRVLSSGHEHAEVLSAVLTVTGRIPESAVQGLELFIAPLDHERVTTAAAIPLVAESITVIS
jgi:hypothetical protein